MISGWKHDPVTGGEYKTATYCATHATKTAMLGGKVEPGDPQAGCDYCGDPSTQAPGGAFAVIHDFRFKFNPEVLAAVAAP